MRFFEAAGVAVQDVRLLRRGQFLGHQREPCIRLQVGFISPSLRGHRASIEIIIAQSLDISLLEAMCGSRCWSTRKNRYRSPFYRALVVPVTGCLSL